MFELTLFFAPTADLPREEAPRVLSWLTGDERARHERFVFDKHRHEYLTTRAVERIVLSTHVGCPPRSLAFERNAYGKPSLVGRPEVRFNLTNTTELVACALASGRDVGVDAEPLHRAKTVLEVAPTVFTPREQAELDALPGEAKDRRAVELWTLKEAYMKAMGMGMSLPPETFGFTGRALSAPPKADPNPGRWHFEVLEIEGHLVSVAVDSSGEGAPTVHVERVRFGG